MEKTKDITAEQYAKYKSCTVQNIRKHLLVNGIGHKIFDAVLDIKYYSRFYLFVVNEDLVIPD